MARAFFPVFFNNRDMLQYMSMEQRGQLLTQLFDYAEDGALPTETDGILGMAFSVFRKDIDLSAKKYKETCEKNRRNIEKRWGKPTSDDTTECDGIPSNTNAYQKYQAKQSKTKQSKAEVKQKQSKTKQSKGNAALAAVVENEFQHLFGRTPGTQLLRNIAQTGLRTEDVKLAIWQASRGNATNPEAVVTTICRRWAEEGVPKDAYRNRPPQGDQHAVNAPLEDWELDWLEQMERRAGGKQSEQGNTHGPYDP